MVPPEVGVAAGTLVGTGLAGTATASGIGVVGKGCWLATGSTVLASPLFVLSADFVVVSLPSVDCVADGWFASLPGEPPALALALSAFAFACGGPASALLLGSLAGGGLEALLPELPASAGAGVWSEWRGRGAGCGGGGVSATLFWLTKAPKRSFGGGWLDHGERCGAPWNATLDAASELTLNTKLPPGVEPHLGQQGPGQPESS